MAEPGKGKFVVVTGASTGIGLACAEHLNDLGFHVFAGVRKKKDAERLHNAMPKNCTPLILDVCNEDHIAAAEKRVKAACGDAGLWGLVNNAGIVVAGPLEFLPLDEIRTQFEVNITAQIAVTQAFMPHIRQARGRIVFMGSTSGYFSAPFLAPYSITKYAIEAICDSLRVELAPWGIEVVNIQPGQIATPIWDKSKSHAEEMLGQLGDNARELYEDALNKLRDQVEKNVDGASDVKVVSDAVVHALTARRPKTRYKVGAGAKLQYGLSLLASDRTRDKIIRAFMKI